MDVNEAQTRQKKGKKTPKRKIGRKKKKFHRKLSGQIELTRADKNYRKRVLIRFRCASEKSLFPSFSAEI